MNINIETEGKQVRFIQTDLKAWMKWVIYQENSLPNWTPLDMKSLSRLYQSRSIYHDLSNVRIQRQSKSLKIRL